MALIVCSERLASEWSWSSVACEMYPESLIAVPTRVEMWWWWSSFMFFILSAWAKRKHFLNATWASVTYDTGLDRTSKRYFITSRQNENKNYQNRLTTATSAVIWMGHHSWRNSWTIRRRFPDFSGFRIRRRSDAYTFSAGAVRHSCWEMSLERKTILIQNC